MSSESVSAGIIMEVIGTDPEDIVQRITALALMTSSCAPTHALTGEESRKLRERGITTKELHEWGITPSYNSRVLDLSKLLDFSRGHSQEQGGPSL